MADPTVQFVEDLPARTRKGGSVRKSKYDAVYEMLSQNPGRWAFIGEGKALHGSLTAYRKRRDLEDMSVAWRNGSVYAGVGMPVAEKDADNEAEPTEANTAPVSAPEASGVDPVERDAPPVEWPVSTGVAANPAEAEATDWPI